MTGAELVREFIPDATAEECNYILWEHTGFPEFFDPKIGAEEYFRRQLSEWVSDGMPDCEEL